MNAVSNRTAIPLLVQLRVDESTNQALLEQHIQTVMQVDHHIHAVVVRTFNAVSVRAAFDTPSLG